MNVRNLLAAAAAACLFVPSADAGLVGLSSSTPGTLYSLDTATGAATPLVDLTGNAFVSFTGLEALGGLLYATDVVFDGLPGFNFVSIDPITGATTFLSDQDGSANWWGLAADTTAGIFYTVDFDAGGILKSVTTAGVSTSIGATGIFAQGSGMAFDNNTGTLYAVAIDGNLYTLDTATGASTLIGTLGLGAFPNVHQGLAFDDATNTLYLNEADVFDSLYTVDTATGLATLVGANGPVAGDGIDGLAILNVVPEPSSLALAGFGGLTLLGLGLRRHRNRA